jgi:hypothetical protein
MMDGTHILADVAARKIQPSWRVVRGRRWRALRYSLFVAAILVLTVFGYAESVGSFHLPAPWGNLVSSGPVLAALAVVIVGAAVIKPFLDSRTHVVVLLPEGFVYGNTRSGRVYRAVTYASISGLRLGTIDVTTTGIVMKPYLTWQDERRTQNTWYIPGYFTLTAMQLAALVLIQYVQAQGPAADEAIDAPSPSPVSAAEAVALARKDQAPASWEVIQIYRKPTRLLRWTVRYFIYPVMVAVIAIFLVGLGLIGDYVYDALFSKDFVGGTGVPTIVSAMALALFAVPLFVILLVYFYYCFPLMAMYRQVIVVMPEGVVIGDRYTGVVLSAFLWKDVVRLDVSHFANMSIFRFLLTRRKPITLMFAWVSGPYYRKPTEQVVQALLERFAQSRSRATAA